MEEKYLIIKEMLKKYNQEHLLTFYNELDDDQKDILLSQIESIDFEKVKELYALTNQKVEFKDDDIAPIDSIVKENMPDIERNKYEKIGENVIKKGEFAVITMAGGQGTRLGHTGPKGTFMLEIDGKKSLFEIFCNRIKEASIKYDHSIHWYIMTSEENNDETESFFKDNNYFNYGKENISFFKQGRLPMLDIQGKVILENKGIVKLASDGNGGIFEALNTHVINELVQNNVKWVYVFGIDNLLAEMVDPLLIGLTDSKNIKASTKTILKVNPNEKAGVCCIKNGKPAVIEYTEITEELKNKRKANGELELCELNIVSNLFSVELLKKVTDSKLPYHIAFKKCDYIDQNGNMQIAEIPNAYKFEAFIFDIYNYIDELLLLRVKREDEFSPIKNKEGEDSPKTAIEMYNKKYGKT